MYAVQSGIMVSHIDCACVIAGKVNNRLSSVHRCSLGLTNGTSIDRSGRGGHQDAPQNQHKCVSKPQVESV